MPPSWERTRVVKKIAPQRPGARKLAQRYGSALVCVRHREDPGGTTRYTTVELVVDSTPITRRRPDNELLAIRPDPHNQQVRDDIISARGQWDSTLRAWWLTRKEARRLNLISRTVATAHPGTLKRS